MPHSLHHSGFSTPEQGGSDLWTQEILTRLPAGFAEQAMAHHAFERARQIRTPADLLRGILTYVLSPCSLRTLSAWAVLTGVADMSERAWGKRLQKAGPWLRWLLETQLSASTLRHLLPSLPEEMRILLIDASTLKEPGGTGDDWRVHLAYDLLHARMAEVRLTDRYEGEALEPFALRSGDVVVSDRGYGYRKHIAAAEQKQAQVLLRFSPSTCPVLCEDQTPLDIVAWLKEQGEGIHEIRGICCWKKLDYRVRVIAQSLPSQEAEQARQERREHARRHGRVIQEETLYLAGWMLLISTLDEQLWSAEMALGLYRARWQIELIFKRMKQLLKLNQIRSKRPEMVQATVYALLLIWSLQEQEGQWVREQFAMLPQALAGSCTQEAEASMDAGEGEGENASESALSSWLLAKVLLSTLRQGIIGQWSLARFRQILPRLRQLLCDRRKRVQQEQGIRAQLAALFALDPSSFFNCSSA